jgi:hypothetical protein
MKFEGSSVLAQMLLLVVLLLGGELLAWLLVVLVLLLLLGRRRELLTKAIIQTSFLGVHPSSDADVPMLVARPLGGRSGAMGDLLLLLVLGLVLVVLVHLLLVLLLGLVSVVLVEVAVLLSDSELVGIYLVIINHHLNALSIILVVFFVISPVVLTPCIAVIKVLYIS